jgi:pimeloyl-ACP methyl ester carboxylesterase
VSPVGFANERETAYARATLAATRFLAGAVAPVAPAIAGNRVLRTMLSAHVAARSWRIPPADTVLWTRMYAQAPSFWPLLRSAPGWQVRPPRRPTTVAWGERDRLLIFSRQAPRARRALPAAQHVTLTGCGHVPTWDDPEQVARVLLEASTPS